MLRIISNARTNQPAPLFDQNTDEGVYRGNALANAQIALIDAVLSLPDSDAVNYGTLSLERAIVEWRNNAVTLGELVEGGQFKYFRNGDSMFHVQKVQFFFVIYLLETTNFRCLGRCCTST